MPKHSRTIGHNFGISAPLRCAQMPKYRKMFLETYGQIRVRGRETPAQRRIIAPQAIRRLPYPSAL